MYKRYIKRLLDIVFSALGLILLSPVLLLIAVLVRCSSGRPVIFRQIRIGRDGKTFPMYKFRTMVVGAETAEGGVYSDRNDCRQTKIGKLLRITSLDELPQLINILRGEMSFIGPRPPLTYHPWPLENYTQRQLRMFEVRPGITGWAQVHGRKQVEWNRRIELNIWYIDHLSFLLDCSIFFRTIAALFSRADNENTTPTV